MDNKGYGYMGSRIPFILNTERKPGEKKVKDINENGEYATFDCIAVDVDVAGLQPSGELSITENNTYDVTSYASAVVNVPNPSTGTKDITENGNNIDVKDYAAVNVNVPNPSSGTLEITENGEGIDVTEYAAVDVNVSTSTLMDLDNENSSFSMDLETRCSHMSLYGGWYLEYSDPRYDLMLNNKGYQAIVSCSYDESAEEGHRCTFELMSGYELVRGEEYGRPYGSCILIAPVICGQDLNLSWYDINGYFMMCYEFSSEQIAEALEEYPYNECYIYSMDGFCVGSFSVSEKIRTNS